MNLIPAINQVLIQGESLNPSPSPPPVAFLHMLPVLLKRFRELKQGCCFYHSVPKVKCLANLALIPDPHPPPPYLDMEGEGMLRQISLETKLRKKKWKEGGRKKTSEKDVTCVRTIPFVFKASPPPLRTVSSFALINFSLQLIS